MPAISTYFCNAVKIIRFENIDNLLVAIANLFNLLIVGIMLSRPGQKEKLERALGLIVVILTFPLLGGMFVNFYYQRPWWTIVLPGILIFFCFLEFLLDYVFKISFRQSRWLWGYLLFFYLAQWGMIGYGFGVNWIFGFVTLLTYFLSLAATAYSYAKVGHGKIRAEV